jgi:hypothetical protein
MPSEEDGSVRNEEDAATTVCVDRRAPSHRGPYRARKPTGVESGGSALPPLGGDPAPDPSWRRDSNPQPADYKSLRATSPVFLRIALRYLPQRVRSVPSDRQFRLA